MARRKFRSNQRHEPVTERSFQEYILSTSGPQTSRAELLRLVRGGEDSYLELKVKLSNPERIAQEVVALANTAGGVLVFGVNDQLRVEGVEDPEAVQEELVRICRDEVVPPIIPYIDRVAFDNGRRVVALDIEGKRRPYRTRDGRFYIRIGAEKREASRDEIAQLLDETRPLKYEEIAALGATIGDIDEAYLWTFLRGFAGDAFDETAVKNYPTKEVLERDLLLATTTGSEVAPTIAGLLLFGKDERVAELFPRSAVVATRYGGETIQAPIIEKETITGNLLTLYEKTMKFVERYIDLWETRPRNLAQAEPDSPVPARANYPRSAVTEAIANMLTHRDLSLRDQVTRVNILDRGLEFINPRRSAGFSGVAQRAIRFGIPQRLNPQLAAIFSNPAYGLKLPEGGLPMLLRDSRLFSGRRADIVSFNDEFRVRLYGV